MTNRLVKETWVETESEDWDEEEKQKIESDVDEEDIREWLEYSFDATDIYKMWKENCLTNWSESDQEQTCSQLGIQNNLLNLTPDEIEVNSFWMISDLLINCYAVLSKMFEEEMEPEPMDEFDEEDFAEWDEAGYSIKNIR